MTLDYRLIVVHWPLLWSGIELTLQLAAGILALSTLFGLLIALARISSNAILSWLAAAYVNVFRALPVLVVLYFTFYALPQVAFPLSPVEAALFGLTLASTAYLSEDMRSGLRAIDPGQWQACRALGLSYSRTIRRVILPQAIRVMLGPYITRAIIIVKATAVAGIVAVGELTGQAYGLISITYRAFEFLTFAALVYLLLNGCLAILQAWAERHFSKEWAGRR